jgi:hypothetical protein
LTRVETGALDDRRHIKIEIAAGIVGWLLVIALVVWLAFHADEVAIRLTLFLTSVAVIVAILATSLAIDLLRPPLIRDLRREPEPILGGAGVDALGRRVETAGARDLGGEVTIVEEDGIRRYRPGAAR